MSNQTAEQAYEAAVDHEFDAAAEAATLIDAFDIDAAIDKQLASMGKQELV